MRNSLRQEILDGLVEERSEIRRAAANCITAIVRIASLSTWSNLPGLIASALSSSNLIAQNGALEAIVMLAEDTNDQWIYPFDAPSAGPGSSLQSAPLTLVMQPLFQLMVSSEPRTKLLAATAMLHFADGDLGKAAFHKDLEVLSILTNDASTQMKCVVIKSLACIVRGAWDVAQPSMNSILSFVVEGVRDRDDDTAKAACEFFDVFSTSAISQDEVDAQMRERAGEKVPWQGLNQALLKPHLPLLVQLLVSRMQMTEEDLALMSYSNDLGDVADRPEDVRPHIRSGASNAVPKVDGETKGINDDDDEDEDDDGDDAHGEVKTFTVRQAAARALEMLSQCLNTEVALVVIPELQRLFSIGNDKSRWVERELAVLVLGTISDGCVDDLANDLQMLLDFLLSLLKDPYPSVRSISAWAIGRYAKWISDCNAEAVEDNNAQGLILRVCVESLSAALNDSNRGVQLTDLNRIKLLKIILVSMLGNRDTREGVGPMVRALVEGDECKAAPHNTFHDFGQGHQPSGVVPINTPITARIIFRRPLVLFIATRRNGRGFIFKRLVVVVWIVHCLRWVWWNGLYTRFDGFNLFYFF